MYTVAASHAGGSNVYYSSIFGGGWKGSVGLTTTYEHSMHDSYSVANPGMAGWLHGSLSTNRWRQRA
jgi:hypothetical protein